jgi:ABC-type sugar transport system permease subunit
MEKKNSGRKKRDNRSGLIWFLFLLPAILGIILFIAYPTIEAFRLSFYKSNGTIERFIGLKNYIYVFNNEVFRKAIFNTFFITFFQLVIVLPVAFLIACGINHLTRGKNLLKCLFFIPYVTPAIAAGTLFLFVLHPNGILNQFTSFFGIPSVSWLENGWSARFGAVFLSIWRSMGFNIIIFLAYLQAISPEYYEAAQIDGSSGYQSMRYITLPLMRNAFSVLFIMGWINGLQRFTDVYALGGMTGSPARALHTLVAFIYERGFGNFEFGVASAASYILFAIIFIFTLFNLRITETK